MCIVWVPFTYLLAFIFRIIIICCVPLSLKSHPKLICKLRDCDSFFIFLSSPRVTCSWISTDLGIHGLFIDHEYVPGLQAENPLEHFIGDVPAFPASLWDKITSQSFLFSPWILSTEHLKKGLGRFLHHHCVRKVIFSLFPVLRVACFLREVIPWKCGMEGPFWAAGRATAAGWKGEKVPGWMQGLFPSGQAEKPSQGLTGVFKYFHRVELIAQNFHLEQSVILLDPFLLSLHFLI